MYQWGTERPEAGRQGRGQLHSDAWVAQSGPSGKITRAHGVELVNKGGQ